MFKLRGLVAIALGYCLVSPLIAAADFLEAQVYVDGTLKGTDFGSVSGGDYTIGNYSLTVGTLNIQVTANSDPPGTSDTSPRVAYLSTSEAKITNTSTTHHEVEVVITAETFTLPNSNTDFEDITSKLTTNSSFGLLPTPTSTMTTAASGGVTFSRSLALPNSDSSTVDSGFYAKTGSYVLTQTYDINVGKTTGSGVAAQMSMTLTPTPEPWNIVSAVATFIPVSLLYLGLRRRKQQQVSI
ncbi:MAG TPA: hypothetical protein VMJ32_17190 [Pirellulales bacterium]|nr:hypothetical protein [Pirellulales bacterium]